MDDTCETITGYTPEKFLKSGMDFWFPLIHPDDLPVVTKKIIQSQREVFTKGFNKDKVSPVVLEYRFKRPDGQWWKMKDTKYLLFPGNQVAIDKILCKFELIGTNEEKEMSAEEILRKNKACTKMLEFAMVHNNGQTKRSLSEHADKLTTDAFAPSSKLTKREKEILLLIGKGLSTKMIADKCNISINTVETHRRHLLEKLNAKNSM
jgi:DNA-binding CsgD family transcriptional regulator